MTSRGKDERGPRLRGFREVQRLAYACAEAVAARPAPGVTEREAARMQREWLLADLEPHRALILRAVRERRPLREIYGDVDRPLVRQGYANRHRACPLGVIAHKVGRVAERRWLPQLFGFGTQSPKGLLSDAVHGHRDGWSPLWSPYRFSDHPPRSGLWAVEPHLGFRCTGAEFEEIPVVTDSRDPERTAFWLDDDLPHVRRWAEERVAA